MCHGSIICVKPNHILYWDHPPFFFSLSSRGPAGGPRSLAHKKKNQENISTWTNCPSDHHKPKLESSGDHTLPPRLGWIQSLSSRWRCGFKAAVKTAPSAGEGRHCRWSPCRHTLVTLARAEQMGSTAGWWQISGKHKYGFLLWHNTAHKMGLVGWEGLGQWNEL